MVLYSTWGDYMDMNVHIKKFFKDIYGDDTVYSDYLDGKIVLDKDLYEKWYKEMLRRKDCFFNLIKSTLYQYKNISCLETTLHKDFTLTNGAFNKKEIEIQEHSFPEIKELELGQDRKLYVCNGCYKTTLENIYKVLNNGAFLVGVCCNKNVEEYKETVEYYSRLKDFLMQKGYGVGSYESYLSGIRKSYVLTYNNHIKR